ncbi:MAG: hypothetical protein Q9164_001218 [Protoblastenia rupestris]
MKEEAVLQRVASASVTVDSQLISSIGKGVLVFAAVAEKDTRKDVEAMASKVLKLKMWPDEAGDTFTLMASTKKGNKPDFHSAAGGNQARELYDSFYAKVQELYDPSRVKSGVFQAMMEGRNTLGCTVFVDILTQWSEYTELWACECGLFQSRCSGIPSASPLTYSPSPSTTNQSLQVTIVIETSPSKDQEKDNREEAIDAKSDKQGEEQGKVVGDFQMPNELLE